MERRLALEILYKNLPDKSKVLAGKRVVSVIETEQGVRVNFKDGGFEEGDIAIGCDGAHSIVRDAMWEMAGKISPGLITASEKRCKSTIELAFENSEHQRNVIPAMKIEYTCLIGTTSGVPGLDHSPDMHVTSGHGHTIQIVTQPNAAYFLLYQKLPQPLPGSSRTSYNQDDADRAAAKFADTPVTENVLFGEVYRKRSRSQLVDLEEVVFDHWHHGRLAILGDAAHKVTPNFAFGGNCAIEGVAALANALHKALHASPNGQLDQPAISAALAEYEARQKPRVKKIFDMCYYATRMQAWDGLLMHFISRVVVPLLGDERVADQTAKLVKGGVRLDYLPVPEHPSGSCAWDDEVMEAEGDGGKPGAVGSVALWQSLVTKEGVPALYLLLLAGVIMSAGIRYAPLLITGVST